MRYELMYSLNVLPVFSFIASIKYCLLVPTYKAISSLFISGFRKALDSSKYVSTFSINI